MEAKNRYVGMSVIKKDAKALLAGKPLYTDDIAPKDCLIVKLLRSPHAHALIEEIDLSRALKVEGIETILTYQDCSQKRFTMAHHPRTRHIPSAWLTTYFRPSAEFSMLE